MQLIHFFFDQVNSRTQLDRSIFPYIFLRASWHMTWIKNIWNIAHTPKLSLYGVIISFTHYATRLIILKRIYVWATALSITSHTGSRDTTGFPDPPRGVAESRGEHAPWCNATNARGYRTNAWGELRNACGRVIDQKLNEAGQQRPPYTNVFPTLIKQGYYAW